jgi:hypothetical protein
MRPDMFKDDPELTISDFMTEGRGHGDPSYYTTSWSWLMNAVEKIVSMGYDVGICRITIKDQLLSEVIISPLRKNDYSVKIHKCENLKLIDVTWQCVFGFVNNYELNNNYLYGKRN